MQEDENYFLWNKGEEFFLDADKRFKTTEFQCHCNFKTCKQQKISKLLICKLSTLRGQILEPITVTSGFRCKEYQAKLRADGVNTVVAKESTHELGHAADIKGTRIRMVDFLAFTSKLFDSIGTANTFLHVDIRPGYRRWKY